MIIFLTILTFMTTVAGGMFALKLQNKLYLVLGFSAGAILGVTFFDLLPTAFKLSAFKYDAGSIGSLVALGFSFYMILNGLIVHLNSKRKTVAGNLPAQVAAFILVLHSLLDGITIGLAFQISPAIGGFVTSAVLIHDFADGINIINVIIKENGERKSAIKWLILNGLAPVIGAFSTFFYHLPQEKLGVLLALVSGFFIYLGASEFIPHSRAKSTGLQSSLLTLAGIVVIYLAVQLSGL